MSGKTFVDTNVLVYLHDRADEVKHTRAASTLRGLPATALVLSAQVLTELYSTLTRKLTPRLASGDALQVIEKWAALQVIPLDKDVVLRGLAISGRYQLSSWDGLIVAAAVAGGCDTLLTEDLQDGATYDGVTVVNPFNSSQLS